MSEQAATAATENPAGRGARAAARRMTAAHGAHLEAQVEAALHVRGAGTGREAGPGTGQGTGPGGGAGSGQYLDVDPFALGSLIVSVASLAWTIYQDLRTRAPSPSRSVIARRVRIELPADGRTAPEERDRIIDIVVEEVTRDAEDGTQG
ncbi:hypothetical protein FGW37_29310 [Streptomyces rectiverticillatus]|uniref:hypothetical protein n=1 Tax=Streptomyces rectiverticillatus TaxID=173860 RepID=UPI0015C2D00A|nr:hypothetical protein [Streptomyces rectiverticillatus]QLE75157.1 hypothetical protein FGW37_29310 [Streptomyces rectiverticillatus]